MDSVQLLKKRYHRVSILLAFLLAATFFYAYFTGTSKDVVVLSIGVVSVIVGVIQLFRKPKL